MTLSWEKTVKVARRGDRSGGLRQRAWVEIDLAALAYNIRQLRTLKYTSVFRITKTSYSALVKS